MNMTKKSFKFSFRRWLPVAVLALAALCAPVTPLQAQQYWFETYERAVDLLDRGETARAASLLDAVIEAHPVPVSCLRVPGDRCLDYLPYYHRARVQISRGDIKGASHSLDVEAAFGVVFQNRRTQRAYMNLREEVRARGIATPASAPLHAVPPAASPR